MKEVLYTVFEIYFDSDCRFTDFWDIESAMEYAEDIANEPDVDVVYIDIGNGDRQIMIKQ